MLDHHSFPEYVSQKPLIISKIIEIEASFHEIKFVNYYCQNIYMWWERKVAFLFDITIRK
jgi:hypothetical protein